MALSKSTEDITLNETKQGITQDPLCICKQLALHHGI